MAAQTRARPVARFALAVVDRPWTVLIATAVISLLCAAGARFLVVDSSYQVWFGPENPELTAYEAIQSAYTRNDSILFVVVPRDGRVFTDRALSAVEMLTAGAWKIPFSRRVDSVTNFQHTRADGDDLVVGDLVEDTADLPQSALDETRGIALAEPTLRDRLVSDTGHVTGVNVVLQFPRRAPDELPQAVTAARALRDRIVSQYPDVDVRMTGLAMLDATFLESSEHDLATLTPLMFLVLAAAMVVLLRSLVATLATLLVVVLATAIALGTAGWLGFDLNPASATAPTIIMTLAIADSVHILVTMFGELRRGGDRRAAVLESLRVNMQPVFLTSLTTAIGFLSMNFSDAPPFRDLGNITTIGVAAAFALSVVTLPALMMVVPLRASPGRISAAKAMARLGDFVVARRVPLLGGSTALIVGLAAFIPSIELNDEFVKYFGRTVPFRADTEYTMANLTGLYFFEYSFPSQGSGGVADPEYLEALDRFTEWARAQPVVRHVQSLTDTMRRLNKSMHGDDAAWYRLPEDRELAAQYLLLYELSLPFGLDLNDQINIDKSATRVVVTFNNISAVDVRKQAEHFDRWIAGNLPPYMATRASGTTIMFAHISQRNIEGMLFGTFLAMLLISLVLILALRSLGLGLVSLLPNVVPAAMAFGLWGLWVRQVDMAVAVIAAMTLGIVVDDTIHFLSKYLRARREKGLTPPDAVRYAFSTVGMALCVTTAVLMVGFLVLSLSDFAVNSRMGLMTAITLALALLADFLFLPPLLLTLEGKRHVLAKPLPTA